MVNKTEYNLENQFSLITGAAGLLGEQHAIALLDISSNIILTDINAKKLNKLKKKLQTIYPYLKILSFVMDVTSEKSIRKVSRRLIKNKINLKVLINNAAIDAKFDNKSKAIKKGSIENLNLKVLKKEIDVGLIGYILVTKIFVHYFTRMSRPSLGAFHNRRLPRSLSAKINNNYSGFPPLHTRTRVLIIAQPAPLKDTLGHTISNINK